MCFLTAFKTVFLAFVCLTAEFTIYFCGTSKLAYSLGPNKLVKVRTYIRTFTNFLEPKTFSSHFFRLKNKTALIPSFILLLINKTRREKKDRYPTRWWDCCLPEDGKKEIEKLWNGASSV